jgi:RNA polymerase sigma factor (sigma-70 family)
MFSLSRSIPPGPVGKVAVDGGEGLIAKHYGVVYNLAYRTMGRREDAEDIAQQTFARALPRLADLRDPDAAGGWLCRIAANLCLDELKRRQQAQEHVEPDLDGLPDADPNAAPATIAERREVRAAVWSAALSLPHQQRLVLALREWQDLSYKQIAEALEISVSAVESILFNARQGFRRAYQAGAEPWPTNEACKWMVERLSASIDEELPAGERARIDAHLPRCVTCQFAARELRATKRLYGLMPLASAPAGAQLAALMAAPAVGVAPVVVAGFSGASGGGVLISLGAAKVGFGTAAAMVGSAVMMFMGSDGSSAFGTVEAALAAAAPAARTAVTVPTATPQPVVEVAFVAAHDVNVAEAGPSDPPRLVAELAKVELLLVAPDVTPAAVPAVVPDAADRRGVSPVAEAQSQATVTPIGREASGVAGPTSGPAGSRSGGARTAAPVRVIANGNGNGNGVTPPGHVVAQNAPARSVALDPPGQAVRQDPPGPAASKAPPNDHVEPHTPPSAAAGNGPPGVRASSPPTPTGASATGAAQLKAPPSRPAAAAAPQVTPANAAPGGKPPSPNVPSSARPDPPPKPDSAAKPPSPPVGASPAQVGGGTKPPGPPAK